MMSKYYKENVRMHFKEGAVIEFTVIGEEKPCCGKVVDVTCYDVVFIKQKQVSLDEQNHLSEDNFDSSITVDVGQEIILDREFIADWTYARNVITKHEELFAEGHVNPSEYNNFPSERINTYENGYCRGTGNYYE